MLRVLRSGKPQSVTWTKSFRCSNGIVSSIASRPSRSGRGGSFSIGLSTASQSFFSPSLAVPRSGSPTCTKLSSTAMARILILNDLFVAPEGRGRGAGLALVEAAAEYGRRVGAVQLALSTELTNTTAQQLYEKAGWKRDTVFCAYQLTL